MSTSQDASVRCPRCKHGFMVLARIADLNENIPRCINCGHLVVQIIEEVACIYDRKDGQGQCIRKPTAGGVYCAKHRDMVKAEKTGKGKVRNAHGRYA